MTDQIRPTARTRIRRGHERAVFDRDAVHAILDAAPLCHIAWLLDGAPALTPTLHWRIGDRVYWHGSSASRTLRRSAGAEICLNATILDGYVLARSAFHHSVNYRSVTVFGVPQIVEGAQAKTEALRAMMDHLVPGRWEKLREINDKELKATTVMWLPLDEVSAKVRAGGPIDDEEDYALDIWAGTVPVAPGFAAPVDDARLKPGLTAPAHVRDRFRAAKG